MNGAAVVHSVLHSLSSQDRHNINNTSVTGRLRRTHILHHPQLQLLGCGLGGDICHNPSPSIWTISSTIWGRLGWNGLDPCHAFLRRRPFSVGLLVSGVGVGGHVQNSHSDSKPPRCSSLRPQIKTWKEEIRGKDTRRRAQARGRRHSHITCTHMLLYSENSFEFSTHTHTIHASTHTDMKVYVCVTDLHTQTLHACVM